MPESPTPDRVDTELRRAMGELAMEADTPLEYEELSTAVITSYDEGNGVMKQWTWLAAAAVLVVVVIGAIAWIGGDDQTTFTDPPAVTPESGDDGTDDEAGTEEGQKG